VARWLGTVRAIAVRGAAAAAPALCDQVQALPGLGLDGDVHADPRSPRQVLLAGAPAYQALGLAPGSLRENLLLDLDTAGMASGSVLRIGRQASLRLSFQCEACGSLDAHAPGLSRTVGARRGMLARVLDGGPIRVGDPVTMLEQELPALSEDWRERVARILEAVPPGQVIGYAELAHVAGVQSSYCRAFPRLLARLGPAYAVKAVPARGGATLLRWDGGGFYAQDEG
jgi:hypothetical protein